MKFPPTTSARLRSAAPVAAGLLLLAGCGLQFQAEQPAPAATGSVGYIELQPQANQGLAAEFSTSSPGDNLAALATGEQTLEGVKFKIGPGMVRLGGVNAAGFPPAVRDIRVGRRLSRLYFLHGTFSGGFGGPGHPLFVADGTPIGHYEVLYADRTSASIPIVYGEDLRDWWNWDQSKPATRGVVAWTGATDASRKYGLTTRLYILTWKNRYPEREVASLDFVSTGRTACAPFCVAISADQE